MARRVKWIGNPADLPQPQETTKKRTVRYVGMGPGGNAYQSYTKPENNTARTVTEEDTLPDSERREKFNAGEYAGDAGKLFLNGVAEGLAATGASVENLIGKGLDKLFPGAGFEGSGLFNVLYNGRPDWKWAGENGLVGIKQDREYNQESLQRNADKVNNKVLKKAAEFGGDIAYGLGNAAPMAAEAMATGGASAAASLTKEGILKTGAEVVEKTGVLNTLSKATRDMLTSKDYWTSFASEVGMDYYDAKDNGATEDEALRYALYSAGLNSVIEIGGGIQKIPERPNFKTWLKSAHEEGMEEVQQGIVSRLLENAVYNKGNPIVSVTDDNAVINPVNALGEYAGGAAVGGILSGGQQLTQRAINRSVRAEQNKQAKKVYGDTAQDLVAESLELNPGNDLAKKYQERLDNGKKLSGRQLMRLIEQNETDTVASDKAKIQSAAEGRLAQLGETGDAAQIAQAITKQVAGEKLSTAEQSLIDESRFGRRVANEIDPENVKAVVTKDGITPRDTFASEWTGKLDTKRIYPEVFNRLMPQPQKTKEVTARQEGEVTGAKYNAETGKLDAIVTNEAGEVKTVPAAEAEMTPMQEELFDWANELKLEAAGPLMVRAYQPEQNMELYTRSFKLAYEYGKAGMPMDYVEKSEGVNYLHPTQIKLAYEEGQAATQRKVQAREEKIRSGGTTDSTTKKKGSVSLRGAKVGSKTYAPVNRKTVDSRQWASVKAMRAFSRAVGVDVVFYQSQANERGVYEGANGFYKGGKLYLDINAGRDTTSMTETAILKTAAHELTHFIQANSAQYEALKSFVVNKLIHEEGVSFEDLVADKQRREPGLEYDEAVDEMVADACEMMLGDSAVVEQLAKENRSLAEKIRDWLREWVENLKIALEGLQADRTESRTMMQYARELQEIWDNALMDAARNNRGTARETAESRQQARAESGESIEPGEKTLKGKRDDDKMGAINTSLKEDLENGKARKENRGAFLRRTVEEGYQVFEGKSAAYGYRSVRWESAGENARQIQKELTELGIDAEIIDGDILWNLDGISSARRVPQATTVEKKKILVNAAASLAPRNTAGHEAFHLWYGLSARKAFEDVVTDNLIFSSKEFLGYQAVISEAYLGDEANLSDEAQYTKLTEEIIAYISGDIYEGVNDDLLRPMFRDYDAVKAAWVKLCKDNSGGEVRFSVREVGGETMPVLDVQNDTRDYKVAEAYLKTLVDTEHPFATILMDAQPVYIGKDLPGEYKGSEYTHGLNRSTRQVKMQAATNLDEMLLLAENGEWRENVKDKHKQDAKNGWYRYSTRFALPVLDIKKAVDHYTVYSGTLLIRNDADGKSYLYDLLDIKKEKVISSPSFSARERSEVFEPKPSQEQYMQNSRESQAENIEKNQLRELRLSDRAVLIWAAEKAMRERSKRWSIEDLNRFDILVKKLKGLDDAYAELEALKEERMVQLAGRKESELKNEERFELNQTKNRIQTQKNKIQRLEADTYRIESIPQMKELLRKSRSIVEADAADTARRRYREQRYEGQRKAVERRKVERVAKKLITDLNTNNDKKHIPEPLKRPIGELLESLDFISGDARANKKIHRRDLEYGATLRRLKDALDTYRKNEANGTGEGIDGYIDLPPDLSELISETAKMFENNVDQFKPGTNVIASMNLEDISNLYKILSSVREGIVNIDKMFQNEQFERVKFIGEETMRYLTGKEGDAGAIKQMAMWDNTLPWYAFQRFGQGGRSIFEELMDGQDKFAYNANRILKFRKALINDKTVRAWDKEIHELELTTHEGERVKVTMTTTQLMNLYLLSRRKHGLNHILGGGIRLKKTVEPTLVNTVREKVSKDKKKLNQEKTSEHFKLKDAEVGQLLKLLTPEQIEVARALQKFAAEVGGAWGNEITMRRFGFRGFTEENYWTIEVDKQDLSVEPGDKKDGSLYRLQNISAVKPLTEEAKGAVVIRGVFDVFSDHMTDMAKYNAFVLPIIDAQRWLNYKTAHENNEGHVNNRSVQRAMTKVYGAAANNYVIEFLRDLNGVKESGDRGDTLTKRMISKAKRVKVALNSNVAAQQPTSYMRASAVLEHKYLAKAFAAQERDTMKDKLILEQDRKELLEYSGIALWKEMGFFDTDIGHSLREQIKGGQSLSDKIADKTMLGAEWGDKLTWARLWRACKLEVQDKQHLTGEELLKAAAKRFREVIYRTQVVDSTLTRSHNMRSNSTFAKFSTTFMSEPTVSYNVAMYATENMVRETAKLGLKVAVKRNWRQVIRQYQAVLASSVAAALVSAIDAALRDPDDDPFFEKVWKEFFGEKSDSKLENAVNIILGLDGTMLGEINPLSKLPELKGIVNTLSGFGSGRMDMDVITNAQRAVQIWDEYIRLQTGDLEEPTKTTYYGNMTPYGRIYPTLKALSDFSGLPISNLSREVTTLFNTGCWAFGVEENKVRTYQSKQLKEAWENYGKASGVSYAVMYRATQDTKDFKSDKDKDGNAISGSLKAKYVDYIKGLGLNRAQGKAVWEAAKNPLWSDKGTPWG